MQRSKTDIQIDAAIQAAMSGKRAAFMASTVRRAVFIRQEIYDRIPDKRRAKWITVCPVRCAPTAISGNTAVFRDEGWATMLTPEQIERVNSACRLAEACMPKE